VIRSLFLIVGLASLALMLSFGACTTDTGPGSGDDDTPTPSATPSASATPALFLQVCNDNGSLTMGNADTLTCGDVTGTWDWDIYTLTVEAGDCIHIYADNGAGAADLLAFAWDAAGKTYGLKGDYTQLEDEGMCSVEPWYPLAACPEASLITTESGPFNVGIAQWPSGCSVDGPSEYTLYVSVNGLDTDLSTVPTQQDTALPELD